MAEDKERATQQDASHAGAGEMSEAEIDRNLAGSFPASDPPSWTLGTDHRGESQSEPRGVAKDDEAE